MPVFAIALTADAMLNPAKVDFQSLLTSHQEIAAVTKDINAKIKTINPQENIETTNDELINRLFKQTPEIKPPLGENNKQHILEWKRKFYSNNEWKLLDLKEGWDNMIESGALKMISEKCSQYNVPFEVVFLALAESFWQNRKSEKHALGKWQFIESTAKAYSLIQNGKDYRNDAEHSTDAALRLLRDNYERTFIWDRIYKIDSSLITENDRWLYALWQYNRSPKKVGWIYEILKGRTEEYYDTQENTENKGFVHRIFGLRLALEEHFLQEKKINSIAFHRFSENR